ncbi:E3 ubiquitin-protein ligase HERC [Acrasis kona]|uniref:E3 ubiquitin-protein ligase HERC n=1 Tax=Acrasis kona TaxID=1008807 RepID=A0AAW2ZER4_9EUKA
MWLFFLTIVQGQTLVGGYGSSNLYQFGDTKTNNTDRLYLTIVNMGYYLLNNKISQYSSGYYHSMLITSSGSVFGFGLNNLGQAGFVGTYRIPFPVNIPGGKTAKVVHAGGFHSLVITNDNLLYSTGSNLNGALGIGNYNDTAGFTLVDYSGALSGKTIVSVKGGLRHTLCITSDNKIFSFGLNSNGQLGNGNTANYPSAVPVDMSGVMSGKTIIQVEAGGAHSLALSSDGKVYGWGNNIFGSLGTNTTLSVNSLPLEVISTDALSGKIIKQIKTGLYHSLLLSTDGIVFSMGKNDRGQLGTNNNDTQSNIPVPIYTGGDLSGKTIKQIGCGAFHNLLLTTNNTILAFGSNTNFELGNVDEKGIDQYKPVKTITNLIGNGTILQVDGGIGTTFIMWNVSSTAYTGPLLNVPGNTFDQIAGIGPNNNIQIGNGDASASQTQFVPSVVIAKDTFCGKKIAQHHTISYSSLILTSDGIAYSNGINTFGANGIGTTASSPFPSPVLGISKKIAQVSSGSLHSLVLSVDGLVYGFGYNNLGQLGIATTTFYSLLPTPVATSGVLYNKFVVQAIAANGWSLLLTSDGFMIAFGANADYQLGNGDLDTFSQYTPGFVVPDGVLLGKKVVQISTGDTHAMALTSDGDCVGFGYNTFGQVGNNNTANVLVPASIVVTGSLVGKTIVQVSGGYRHTLFLASTGEVFASGSNSYGQLGINNAAIDKTLYPVPIYVSNYLNNRPIAKISAGYVSSLIQAVDGSVYSFGYAYGQGAADSINLLIEPYPLAMTGPIKGNNIVGISVAGQNFFIYYNVTSRSYNGTVNMSNSAFRIGAVGSNSFGQLGVNENNLSPHNYPVMADMSTFCNSTMIQIQSGSLHSSVLFSDGTVYSSGSNINGQIGTGSKTNSTSFTKMLPGLISNMKITQISSIDSHTLLLNFDGKVYGTGLNTFGQLGDSTTTTKTTPVSVDTCGALYNKNVAIVRAGSTFSLVLTTDNLLISFGSNSFGQLGTGNTVADSFSSSPLGVVRSKVWTDRIIKDIQCGYFHSLFITADGLVYSFGNNRNGQLGIGTTTDSYVPIAPAVRPWTTDGRTAVGIKTGGLFSMVLTTDGTVYSFGSNAYGQLCNNDVNANIQSTPTVIYSGGLLAGKSISRMFAGPYSTMLLTTTNEVFSCGYNLYNQLSVSTTNLRNPVPSQTILVNALGGIITDVGMGYNHTSFLYNTTSVYQIVPSPSAIQPFVLGGFGENICGTIGVGNNSLQPVPVPTITPSNIVQFNIKYKHTLLLTSDNNIYAMGYNKFSQLGNGNTSDVNVPTPILKTGSLIGKTISMISAGGLHSLLLTTEGIVYSFGNNQYGQLGNGDTTESQQSTAQPIVTCGVLFNKTIVQIVGGLFSSVLLSADNRLYTFGNGANGAIGNGDVTQSNYKYFTAIAVIMYGALSGKSISQISASHHVLVLTSSGNVYGWGKNDNGQLGIGNNIDQYAPVAINQTEIGNRMIVQVSCGSKHSLVLSSDGNGQLGINDNTGGMFYNPVTLMNYNVSFISAGWSHSIVISNAGVAYTFGENL